MSDSRLILADDHEVVRQGLRNIVEHAGGLKVVGEATDGAEALRQARETPADLLILDIALPVLRGMQVLEQLRGGGSTLPVLFYSMHPANQYVDFARRHGAQGFVGKDEDSNRLLRATRHILMGGTWFPQVRQGAEQPFDLLSRREADVLRGLAAGESLSAIAVRLGVGAKSVSTYRRRILDKLGAQNNAELIALVLRHGDH